MRFGAVFGPKRGSKQPKRSLLERRYVSYYDIFVRHAFGNFRDILREVTYSPVMGDYLTYKRNRAYDSDGVYPDENYAREIQQLRLVFEAMSVHFHTLGAFGRLFGSFSELLRSV